MAGSFPTGTPAAATPAPDQFGLGGLNAALSSQETLTANRQQAEQDAQQVEQKKTSDLARIAGKGVEVHQQLLEQLQPLAKTVNDVSIARADQAKLSSSSNPLDFFTAIGNKITNPEKYTAAGQEKTLQQASQLANLQTFIAGQKQEALSAAGTAVVAGAANAEQPLNQAKLLENQGQELIAQKALEVQQRGTLLAQNQQMANITLAGMTEQQVRVANQTAATTGRPVSIAGIDIQPGLLQDRVDALDTRATSLANAKLAGDAKNLELVRKNQKQALSTMNPEELRQILQGGGDPNQSYDLSDVKSIYDIKMQAQTDGIQRMTQGAELADATSTVVLPAINDINRMTPAVPPGPAKTALDGYRTTTHVAAGAFAQYEQAWATANPGKDPTAPENQAAIQASIPIELKVAVQKAISDQAETTDKAVVKQAKLDSRGDANLETVLTEKYRGNPVPQAAVEAGLSQRLTKGQPLTDLVPPEVGKKMVQIYQDTLSAMTKQNQLNPISADSKEVINQRAVAAAIQGSVNDRLTQRSQSLMSDQVDDPSNPLNGKVSKNGILVIQNNADQLAIQHFQSGSGFSADQMALVKAGTPDPSKGVTQDNVLQFQAARQTEFFMQLDGIQQGLAGDYSKWWSEKGGDYINGRSQKQASAANAGGVQEAAIESFANPMEKQQSAAYMNHMTGTYEGSYDAAIQKRYGDLVSFNQKPDNRQAALLQLDGDLNDSERKEVMKNFIMPLTSQAAAKKMNYGQTNVMVEQAIAHAAKNGVTDLQGAVDSPLLGRALKKMANNRTKTVENLESIMTQPFWGKHNPTLPYGPNAIQTNQSWLSSQTAQRNYAWFHEAQKESK